MSLKYGHHHIHNLIAVTFFIVTSSWYYRILSDLNVNINCSHALCVRLCAINGVGFGYGHSVRGSRLSWRGWEVICGRRGIHRRGRNSSSSSTV